MTMKGTSSVLLLVLLSCCLLLLLPESASGFVPSQGHIILRVIKKGTPKIQWRPGNTMPGAEAEMQSVGEESGGGQESPGEVAGSSSVVESTMEMDSADRMKQKLLSESQYPFKFPLLAAAAVLSGKGLTDALITVIKVSIGFKGASLVETFFGVPVLGIDAMCVAAGIFMGTWTWNNMRAEAR